jgi:membrane fusion protein (multidrug efflux system)
MQNQTFFLIFSAVVITAINFSCSTKAEPSKEAPAQAAVPALPVDAVVAHSTSVESSEKLAGSLIASRSVDIMSELPRKVNSILFKDGSVVTQGQVLFKLDDADLRAKHRQVLAELNLAKLTEARLKLLLVSETIRQEEYDVALSRLDALKATEELVRTEIAKTVITAPFSGLIGISKVHRGALVTPGLPLVNIQEHTKLKILFSVSEKYLPVTKAGSKVHFTTTVDEQVYSAIITSTEASLDEQSRNIIVHATVQNANQKLRPGMSVVVDFKPASENAAGIMIPTEALIAGEKGYSVFLIKNGAATITPVTIGNRSEDNALITSGINNGDTVMTSNLLRASNGVPVSVVALQNK